MAATSLALVEKSLLPSGDTLNTMLTISETLYKSGLLPAHIKSPQAAFAIIQKGMELGIPPMHAMSNIACIQGKPTCNSELMLALIYRDHGDAAIVFAETSANKCTVNYRRRNWHEARQYAFTIEDAKRAGLSGGNWTKYPAAMLRARCISAVARLAFPDSIGGMYTPEELGATVTVRDDGEVIVSPVIDAEIIEPPPVEAKPERTPLQQEIIDLWKQLEPLDERFKDGKGKLAHLQDIAYSRQWDKPNALRDVSEENLNTYKSILLDCLAGAEDKVF